MKINAINAQTMTNNKKIKKAQTEPNTASEALTFKSKTVKTNAIVEMSLLGSMIGVALERLRQIISSNETEDSSKAVKKEECHEIDPSYQDSFTRF